MDINTINDFELIELISKGNHKAFDILYNKYSDVLFRYGKKLTQNQSLIEDCIHESFLKIWDNRERIKIEYSLKFYLLKIFKREVIKEVSKNKNSVSLESEAFNYQWEQSFLEILTENQIMLESNENIKMAVNLLSDRQREAVFLKYIEGLSYEEVSKLMDIQVNSLYNLVSKALKIMYQFLLKKQNTAQSIWISIVFWKIND
ncbi:RNA polymerase sigma factor [Aquiflexum sp.]|uniref:RNA polymerase sigma factor n=1 Tax=Aquiflexum sp. TaxID=1872584 RepID=UPI003593A3DF